MKFTWTTQSWKLGSVRKNYREIAQRFCDHYYKTYDTNFPALSRIYKHNSMFTYIDKEFCGFKSLSQAIWNSGIRKFEHKTVNATAQPVGFSHVLILTHGNISINGFENKYAETILLKKENNGQFYVHQTIFNLIPDELDDEDPWDLDF